MWVAIERLGGSGVCGRYATATATVWVMAAWASAMAWVSWRRGCGEQVDGEGDGEEGGSVGGSSVGAPVTAFNGVGDGGAGGSEGEGWRGVGGNQVVGEGDWRRGQARRW